MLSWTCPSPFGVTDAGRVFTLDFATGLEDGRYSRAKIVDMVFFQQGLNRS